jgi:hypothetical protein
LLAAPCAEIGWGHQNCSHSLAKKILFVEKILFLITNAASYTGEKNLQIIFIFEGEESEESEEDEPVTTFLKVKPEKPAVSLKLFSFPCQKYTYYYLKVTCLLNILTALALSSTVHGQV